MNNWQKNFSRPKTSLHRQYEALRAIAIDKAQINAVAKKFKYSINTLYSLIRDCKIGKLKFFNNIDRGPKTRHTKSQTQKLIINYRKENLSVQDIKLRLLNSDIKCSSSTIERILSDVSIPKLARRTFAERGKTLKNTIIPERSKPLDLDSLKPFRYDCPIAGIFFFIPYLIELRLLDVIKKCSLPESSSLNSEQACLSMLLLKLIGAKRLSHIGDYDQEPCFGIFAGLNFLPKSTFMSTYSCRTSENDIIDLQQQIITSLQKKYPDFYKSSFINLDFHSIPHFGEESRMEKVWCGSRNKAMKGANTIFAQDSESNAILYAKADILHKNEANEILKFVAYWKKIRKSITETLVFDCKLTTYPVIDDLIKQKIQFITLRKRTKKLIIETEKIHKDCWISVYIPIPKRKHKECKIFVSEITLPNCTKPIKQIIVTGHGRSKPTYIITNNNDLKLKDILIVYAKRWHIEQKFAELVSFFNLNALSSPLMIRIHFDVLWTIIADTLYHRFAQDLPRFENERAYSLFRHFINMPGQIIYDGKTFKLKIRKRAHTPILLGVKKLQDDIIVPWLNNRVLKIEWTA